MTLPGMLVKRRGTNQMGLVLFVKQVPYHDPVVEVLLSEGKSDKYYMYHFEDVWDVVSLPTCSEMREKTKHSAQE